METNLDTDGKGADFSKFTYWEGHSIDKWKYTIQVHLVSLWQYFWGGDSLKHLTHPFKKNDELQDVPVFCFIMVFNLFLIRPVGI